jgi:hypothetical protein
MFDEEHFAKMPFLYFFNIKGVTMNHFFLNLKDYASKS